MHRIAGRRHGHPASRSGCIEVIAVSTLEVIALLLCLGLGIYLLVALLRPEKFQ